MMSHKAEGAVNALIPEDLECKICYCAYSLSSHRPKVLECCHRLCSKCLVKLLDLNDSPPNAVICPFCRYITDLPGQSVGSLPDDSNLVSALSIETRCQLSVNGSQNEILLSPRYLNSLVSYSATASPSSIRSNYVVITILDSPQNHVIARDYRSSSLDSIASMNRRCTVWNCATLMCQASARALVWFFGLLYFSSLPLGIYMLIMQKTILGSLLLGLVPISLLVIIIYGICQCMCYEFSDCVPP